jgi:hypothetical protein
MQSAPRALNPLLIMSFHWFESWRCAAEMSKRSLEEMRRSRNRMFQDMSFCMESYMRSPAFLETMRFNMEMMSHAKRRMADDAPSASGTLRGEGRERMTAGASDSLPAMTHPKGRSDGDASSSAAAAMSGQAPPVGGTAPPLATLADPKEGPANDSAPTPGVAS